MRHVDFLKKSLPDCIFPYEIGLGTNFKHSAPWNILEPVEYYEYNLLGSLFSDWQIKFENVLSVLEKKPL